MTEEPLEPLDPELAMLLEAERTAPAPAAALERAWTRVARGEPSRVGPSGVRPSRDPSRLGARGRLLLGTAFAAGIVIGATGYALLRPPSPMRVVTIDRPLAEDARRPPPVESAASPAPSVSSASLAPVSSERHAGSPSVTASTAPLTFAAERALLDSARAALSAGDAAHALSRLDEHVRRFPKPRLAEEREALAIQALVLLKRYEEARERAARFEASTPNSLFVPAIDTSLSSIP